MSYIEGLNWRYATKVFNEDRVISEEVLERILEAGRLSASSVGLQNIAIVHVVDKGKRNEVLKHAYNQKQVVSASDLLVLCAHAELKVEDVDAYMGRMMQTRGVTLESLAGFRNMIDNFASTIKGTEKEFVWLANQVYIVMGTLLTACAIERVDSCPMEGFVSEEVDKVLDLDKMGLKSVLLLPLGYRDTSDKNQFLPKVRKSMDEFVIRF